MKKKKASSVKNKKTSKATKPIKKAIAAKGNKAPKNIGASGVRLYAEPKFVPLKPGTTNTGNVNEYDAYASVLQPIPPPRKGASMIMKLEDVIGQGAVNSIQQAGAIVFHAVGDSGADKQARVNDEDSVAAMMAQDLTNAKLAERASFFFHLGDVVYEFGQDTSYYAQFYEPYCMYNAPIFAIPGNHDGMIWDPSMKSLDAFLNNFCAPTPGPAANAGGLLRSTMNQPGVYFTLQAPFVTIIGLYSNVSDKGTGVISSENGKYPNITDAQKNFLISELKRLAPLRKKNQTAVIVAVHHPPYMGKSTETKNFCNDLDDAFTQGGLWPDVILSGHAHLYERFERNVNGRIVPYIIAGCGGYNISGTTGTPDVKVPPTIAAHNSTLKSYIVAFGYLKIKVTESKLAVIFNSIDPAYGDAADSILIDLNTHQITEGEQGIEPL